MPVIRRIIVAVMVLALGALVILFTVPRATISKNSAPSAVGPPVNDPPARIVSISPSATEILFELGAGNLLVGVDNYSNYPPETQAIPRVGGEGGINLELLIKLAPDLIILRGHDETLEAFGKSHDIRFYHDPTESLDDLYRAIREIGALVGKEADGAALVQSMRDSLDRIHARVAEHPPVRVLFVVDRSKDRLTNVYSIGKPSYLTSLVQMAGGVSICGDVDVGYPEVSPERIPNAEPEVIIDAMPSEPDDPDRVQFLTEQWNAFPTIPAVVNHRVYVITDSFVTIPSHRCVELAELMARWFHPQAFEDSPGP